MREKTCFQKARGKKTKNHKNNNNVDDDDKNNYNKPMLLASEISNISCVSSITTIIR